MIDFSLIRELTRVAACDARDHLSRGDTERGVELHAHANALQEAYYDAEIPTDADLATFIRACGYGRAK